jgi:DNA (cytosine-5)-methyltransferase 1
MLTSLGGKDFDTICGMLEGADYRYGAVMIDAALFAPQSRERLFILAVANSVAVPVEIIAD